MKSRKHLYILGTFFSLTSKKNTDVTGKYHPELNKFNIQKVTWLKLDKDTSIEIRSTVGDYPFDVVLDMCGILMRNWKS